MNKKYIILTGVAGNVGGQLASFLLERNYRMILTVQKAEHVPLIADHLKKFENNFQILVLDLNEQESIEDFVEKINDIGISGLINCAACDNIDDITTLSYENMKNIMNVNYLGTAYLTKKLVQKNILAEQPLHIVNISSLLSIYGSHKSAAYSASKAALEAFSRNVVCEFADKGIICNTIRLAGINGDVDIYGSQAEVKGFDKYKVKKNTKNELSSIPNKRLANFMEINKLIEFLLSGKSDYINGQVINIDGGISIKYPGYSIDN